MSITLTIKSRKERELLTVEKVDLSTTTVLEFKKMFLKDCKDASIRNLGLARLRFTVSEHQGKPLANPKEKLSTYIDTDAKAVTLYFKDLGPQIGWSTVFYVEYAGPIVIVLALLFLRPFIYGSDPELNLCQKLGVFMALLHYAKRELETMFVHRFSADTMPLQQLFKNCFGYFIIFGVMTMYFFLHPGYEPPSWVTDTYLYATTAAFCIFEFLNLMAHVTLMNLRPPGTTQRKIPYGWGFDFVSCANYLWETCAWFTFAMHS